MQIITVSEKGQVVIPASIRRSLGIKPGMELSVELEDNTIRVSLNQPVATTDIHTGYGMLKAKAPPKPRKLLDFDVAQAKRAAKP